MNIVAFSDVKRELIAFSDEMLYPDILSRIFVELIVKGKGVDAKCIDTVALKIGMIMREYEFKESSKMRIRYVAIEDGDWCGQKLKLFITLY